MEFYGVTFHMVLQYLFFNISVSETGKCLLLTLTTSGTERVMNVHTLNQANEKSATANVKMEYIRKKS